MRARFCIDLHMLCVPLVPFYFLFYFLPRSILRLKVQVRVTRPAGVILMGKCMQNYCGPPPSERLLRDECIACIRGGDAFIYM